MTDIHAHIIPGVDDGSDCMETSMDMLRTAEENGVYEIVATPHFDIRGGYANYASESLEQSFRALVSMARREQIHIRITRGMEIFASNDLPELLAEGAVWTLGGTQYFMIEFDFHEEPEGFRPILRRCEHGGFRPVIAHPERYRAVQRDPQIAYEWCRAGYGLQLNKGSLSGRFGEEARITAMRLISHGLAACIASDAHGVSRRTTNIRGARRIVSEEFGEAHAELLFERNPARILAGRELLGFEPYPFK